MKIINTVAKVILSLILVSPIVGTFGVFPAPTREMYNTDVAFEFMMFMMNHASYISYIMAIVFLLALFALWTKREAIAAFLLLPITFNVIGFHLFLDGGLLNSGSIMAIVLLVLNFYFLLRNKYSIQAMCDQKAL